MRTTLSPPGIDASRRTVLLALSLCGTACEFTLPETPTQLNPDSSTFGDTDPSTNGEDEASESGSSDDTSTAPLADEGESSSSSAGDSTTSATSETGTEPSGCDLWAQDCLDDEKCMPLMDEDGEWTDPQCQPRSLDAHLVGDECTILGTFGSGLDDCAIGSICWNVAEGSSTGTCVAFCQGSPEQPVCEDPSTTCSLAVGAPPPLCLPS